MLQKILISLEKIVRPLHSLILIEQELKSNRYTVTKFEIELVGHEAVTFTAPGDDIQTVAASFGTPDGVSIYWDA